MFSTELRLIHFRTEVEYVILNCSYVVCVCESDNKYVHLEENLVILVEDSISRNEVPWGLQPPFLVTWLKQNKCHKDAGRKLSDGGSL